MGPRLAPLALLLLTLCGQSSAYGPVKIQSFTRKSTASTASVAFVPPKKQAAVIERVQTPPSGNPTQSSDESQKQAEKLLSEAPNTMMLFAFSLAGAIQDMPKMVVHAIFNGMLCEGEKTGMAALIAKAMYNVDSETVPDAIHNNEVKLLGNAVMNITDCATPPSPLTEEFTCLCTQKKAFFFCLFGFFKAGAAKEGVTKKLCPKEAMDALKVVGPNVHDMYNEAVFGDSDVSGFFDGKEAIPTKQEVAAFYCEMTEKKVRDAVAGVYASDGGPWILESLAYAIIFGDSGRTLDEACGDSKFTGDAYGACVCGKDTGFTFCIHKVVGDYLKEKGYLKCDGATKSFDAEKKPTALPVLAKVPKPSSATTTFSMLVPTFAAATLLLRH